MEMAVSQDRESSPSTSKGGSAKTEPKRMHYKHPMLLHYKRFKRSKTAIFGIVVVFLICISALFAGPLSPYSPTEVRPGHALQQPGREFLLGTDMLGRDILSRIIWGSRVALKVGFVSMLISAFLGVILGVIAGYYGGMLDNLIMRILDVVFSFPILLLAIVIVVATSNSGEFSVILALCLAYLPSYARVVRSSVISIKENEYIEALRCLGFSNVRIILRHVIPNCIFSAIIMFTLFVGYAILAEASLSFLGMGTKPPTPSWGMDLQAGMTLVEVAPWVVIFPGLAIMFSVMGFNLTGDGLRDTFDPKLKL
jgi:peptide/nickel transport system permease protein